MGTTQEHNFKFMMQATFFGTLLLHSIGSSALAFPSSRSVEVKYFQGFDQSWRQHAVITQNIEEKIEIDSFEEKETENLPRRSERKKPKSFTQNLRYRHTIKALRSYKKSHGDLVMPRRFIVPDGSPDYPVEWYGGDLSSTVYDMKWWQRHVKRHPDRVSELNELGFVWERLQPEWNIFLEALITYYNLCGDVLVPATFTVPHNDNRWPMATWGIHLGNCVHRIRSRHDFIRHHPDRIHQLSGLNFIWDTSEHAFQIFFKAVSHYSKIQHYGVFSGKVNALRIPSTYVVPSGEEAMKNGWPKDLWGFHLGAKCAAVRHKGVYVKNHQDRRQALESIGFSFCPNAALGWLEVIHASAIYSKLHGRVLNVPQNFVVPSPPKMTHSEGVLLGSFDNSWPWPEYLWGLPLGQRLKDVRLKNRYLNGETAASRKAQLNALGFVWNPKRGRRKQPQALTEIENIEMKQKEVVNI